LPSYYGIEKTSDEICEILVNADLNPDEDIIELIWRKMTILMI
jgi:hypothetical protein